MIDEVLYVLVDGQLVRLGVTTPGPYAYDYIISGLVANDNTVGAANATIVRNALAANSGIGGIPPGQYFFDLFTNPTNSGYSACIQIPNNKGIVGLGGTPDQTQIMYQGGTPTTVTDIIANVTIAGGDSNIWIGNLLVDGQASIRTTFNHGVVFRRAPNSHCRDVWVKDCRGANAGPSTEMFHFDAWHGDTNTYKNCKAYATLGVGGATSSGFCTNFGNNIVWEDCEVYGMGRLMGVTSYQATNLRATRVYAHDNGAQGFNWEYSDYCLVEGSTADHNAGTGMLCNRTSHATYVNSVMSNNGTAGVGGKESGFSVQLDSSFPVTDVQVLTSTIGPGNYKSVVLLSNGVTGTASATSQTLIDTTSNSISGNTSLNSNGGATTGVRTPISYTFTAVPDWPI